MSETELSYEIAKNGSYKQKYDWIIQCQRNKSALEKEYIAALLAENEAEKLMDSETRLCYQAAQEWIEVEGSDNT